MLVCSTLSLLRLLPIALLFAACQPPSGPAPEESADSSRYRYLLGTDPDTGSPIFGGDHTIAALDSGKAEAIDFANRSARLHPELTGDFLRFDPELTGGKTNWDVFASNWWPMSENGTAWRWQPGASDDYNDLSDRDRLSPLEKYDLLFYPDNPQTVPAISNCAYPDFIENGDDCTRTDRPELVVAGPATRWELQNQGNYQRHAPDSWWGHCNGWASYATAEPLGYPRRDIHVRLEEATVRECTAEEVEEGLCLLFRMADIEALMTELYFSDRATFTARRCNLTPDELEVDEYDRPLAVECRDMNAGTLHIAMTGLLGRGATNLVTGEEGRPAFVIDHNYDYQVWNFPLVEFEIHEQSRVSQEEAEELVTGESADSYQFNQEAVSFVRVNASYRMVSDSVPPWEMLLPANERSIPLYTVDLSYVLELDEDDQIIGGEWIASPEFFGPNSKRLHPDFAWMAIDPVGWGERPDDTGGNSDNPFVSYDTVRSLLLCSNDPSTCSPPTPTDPTPTDPTPTDPTPTDPTPTDPTPTDPTPTDPTPTDPTPTDPTPTDPPTDPDPVDD